MKTLTLQDIVSVSGATIINQLPIGTHLQGVIQEHFDLDSGIITTTLLYAWEETKIGCDVTKVPYYYNENYFSSMPNISNNLGQNGYKLWTGYVP